MCRHVVVVYHVSVDDFASASLILLLSSEEISFSRGRFYPEILERNSLIAARRIILFFARFAKLKAATQTRVRKIAIVPLSPDARARNYMPILVPRTSVPIDYWRRKYLGFHSYQDFKLRACSAVYLLHAPRSGLYHDLIRETKCYSSSFFFTVLIKATWREREKGKRREATTWFILLDTQIDMCVKGPKFARKGNMWNRAIFIFFATEFEYEA